MVLIRPKILTSVCDTLWQGTPRRASVRPRHHRREVAGPQQPGYDRLRCIGTPRKVRDGSVWTMA